MEFRRISFLFSIPFCTSFRENNMNLSNALPPQITRRRFLMDSAALTAAVSAGTLLGAWSAPARAGELSSAAVSEAFAVFAKTKRMPPELGAWLSDPTVQRIKPYRVFDNVWQVGVRWVSAYLLKTSDGAILNDTTHEPFADGLLDKIRTAGVRPEEIRYVLMTHGHFDHAGGAERLRKHLPNARFGMSAEGWREAEESARAVSNTPRAWTMMKRRESDMVLKDGDKIRLGGTEVLVLETPGHTWGTLSYVYDVRHGGKTHRAVTIGGQGLNAISGPEQLEAYIRSMERLGEDSLGIDVDLTAHPFSTGLTEKIPAIVSAKPEAPHPLVDRRDYLERLERLAAGAREALRAMKQAA